MKTSEEESASGGAGGVSAATGLRMRDLTRETGLPRETIHFYITQGLVPPGTKTGRNTAEYGSEHLDRLRRIRELQAAHFLPLRAIKALLEDEVASENLTPEQEALLNRVRATLPHLRHGSSKTMAVEDVVGSRVPDDEIEELRDAGVITLDGSGPAARVSAADADVLRAWAAARDAGLGRERGFRPADIVIYDSAVQRLVREEVKRFSRAFVDRPTHEAIDALEKAMPVAEVLLATLHRKYIERLLTQGQDSEN